MRASSPTFTALSNAAVCCGLGLGAAGDLLDLEVLCAGVATAQTDMRTNTSTSKCRLFLIPVNNRISLSLNDVLILELVGFWLGTAGLSGGLLGLLLCS